MKKLKDMGELHIVNKIRTRFGRSGSVHLRLGIGDDAAVIEWGRNRYLLVTTDSMAEGVHFDTAISSWEEVGRSLLVRSLSDLAAMGGGRPLWALLNMSTTVDNTEENVDNFLKGLSREARRNRVVLIGGDTVSSPKNSVFTLTLAGEILKKRTIFRSGARIGDKIMVTGTFGDSAAGLEILKKGLKGEFSQSLTLIDRHLYPVPRLGEASVISGLRAATSMIDSSDGLDVSLGHLCRSSRKGAVVEVDKIPVSSGLCRYSLLMNAPALCYALYGGEDYELVFTVPAKRVGEVLRKLPGSRVIGSITGPPKRVRYVDERGRRVRIPGRGYEHFR